MNQLLLTELPDGREFAIFPGPIHNVVCTCAILAVTGALKVFDLPWVMFPNGAPLGKTWLTGTYMYYKTMQSPDIDYSSALALIIVILGVLLSKAVNRIFKERDY